MTNAGELKVVAASKPFAYILPPAWRRDGIIFASQNEGGNIAADRFVFDGIRLACLPQIANSKTKLASYGTAFKDGVQVGEIGRTQRLAGHTKTNLFVTLHRNLHPLAGKLLLQQEAGKDGAEVSGTAVTHIINQLGHERRNLYAVERLEQQAHHGIAIEQSIILLSIRNIENRDDNRLFIQAVYQIGKHLLQVGIRFRTSRIGSAARKEHGEGAISVEGGFHLQIGRQRVSRVQNHTANSLRIIPHDSLSQTRTVRNAVQIPLIVAQRHPQIRHIGGIFGAVVSGQIDAFFKQPVATF